APYRDPLATIGPVELRGGGKRGSLLDGQWRGHQATALEVAGAGGPANRADGGGSGNALSRGQTRVNAHVGTVPAPDHAVHGAGVVSVRRGDADFVHSGQPASSDGGRVN